MVVFTGCVNDSNYEGVTHHVVKQKFQTVSPCGYGSATSFYILDESGVTKPIATNCGGSSVGMTYYWVWDAVQPGDAITIVRDDYDRISSITIDKG
jgi:hypothetical protein